MKIEPMAPLGIFLDTPVCYIAPEYLPELYSYFYISTTSSNF